MDGIFLLTTEFRQQTMDFRQRATDYELCGKILRKSDKSALSAFRLKPSLNYQQSPRFSVDKSWFLALGKGGLLAQK
ncbi:MAG: hypothetical protein IJ911_05660 [Salinivirgaceae bacterium]|nr:hypothetical protein [Salinivirgaceae bacterium]